MILLPNADFIDLGRSVSGGPYDDMSRPKVGWHMTQGYSLAGARAAFAAYPPHIGYDPVIRQLEQYVSLDRHAYSFYNGEADDEYIIQVEVVGFSENAHNMPDWQVQNIVEDLVNPLEDLIGVPPVVIWHGFHGAGEGIVLASPDSPIRITLNQLRAFSGHLGHQHIPGDGHWDPGRFRIDEVLRRSQAPTEPEKEIDLSGFNGYALEVTSGAITQGENIPVGSAWLYDASNNTLDFYDKAALAQAAKEAGVMHIGVTGERVKNLLDRVRAAQANTEE